MITQQSQLDWIRTLHAHFSSPAVDHFFRLCNQLDTFWFSVLLVSTAWLFLNKKIGIRLLYIFLLSSIVNTFLKTYFGVPRPCQVDPSVGLLCLQSLSFPSGAAQSAAIIFGVTCVEFSSKLPRYLALGFALLLSFSRVYLGVHYPTDILGGWLVGTLLVCHYWQEKTYMKRQDRTTLTFPLIIFLFSHLQFTYQVGIIIGGTIGYYLSDRHSYQTDNLLLRFAQLFIGLFGAFLLYYHLPPLTAPSFFSAATATLWLIHLGPWLTKRLTTSFRN